MVGDQPAAQRVAIMTDALDTFGLGKRSRRGQAGAEQPATSSTREAAVDEKQEPENEAASDYEYDEAHDAVDAAHAAYSTPGPTAPAEIHLTTGIDEDGDYGYDMAHDVPR
jgi:hypothetical protein